VISSFVSIALDVKLGRRFLFLFHSRGEFEEEKKAYLKLILYTTTPRKDEREIRDTILARELCF
jgi:hypothetical protein